MKKFLMAIALCLVCAASFTSCNKVPDKSVFSPLSESEKAKIQENDPDFLEYLDLVAWTDNVPSNIADSTKRMFGDITYRDLYKHYQFCNDTSYWKPRQEQWAKDYSSQFPNIDNRFNSVLAHYDSVVNHSSLNKYVTAELQGFDIDYYSYSGDVEDAYFIFKFTPLQGKIQQLEFNYRYKLKISKKWNTAHCILQNQFDKPYSAYYEIGYFEKDDFYGMTKQKFCNSYDLEIEITKILKDGEIIEKDKLPLAIQNYYQASDDEKGLYKEEIIKEFVDKNYCSLSEFQERKRQDILSRGNGKKIEDFLVWSFEKKLEKRI